MTEHERDFIGYGAVPPDPKWPGNARLAINFVINYEEGSEASIPDGDGFSEAVLTESLASPVPPGERDLGVESMFEYGSRVGFWRLMRIFAERNLPLTFFGCALALERNPRAARAIAEAGHDVACHGWRWTEHYKLSEAEEREQIGRAVQSLKTSLGERPFGWYCRHAPSLNTRRLLAEEGGFLYDSDAYNDELPYWTVTEHGPHLVVPYTLTNNDNKFARGSIGIGEDFFVYLRDAFDLLYEEGARQPKMMSVGLHMRLTGHPARAAGLKRFLDHISLYPDVWICRRLDIARHWHALHPYSPR
jgi:allantoinase